jgi:hypothetical protein
MPYYLQRRIAILQPANCFTSLGNGAAPADNGIARKVVRAYSASINHFVLVPHRAQAVGAL